MPFYFPRGIQHLLLRNHLGACFCVFFFCLLTSLLFEMQITGPIQDLLNQNPHFKVWLLDNEVLEALL